MNRNQAVADRIRSGLNEYLSGLNPQPVEPNRGFYECMIHGASCNMYGFNFKNESNRIAYMYVYFRQYCFVAYCLIRNLQEHIEARFTETEELKVCCIGGGPGIELVALIIFLQEKNKLPPTLHCTIIDKDTEWQETWDKLWENFPNRPNNFQLEVSYESCDLLENGDLPEGVLTAVSAAHIVTMVTAYSRLYNISADPTNIPRLKFVFDSMAKESRMLFIDIENDKVNFENHFWEHHAAPAGVTRVLEPSNYNGGIGDFDTPHITYPQIAQYQYAPQDPISDCRAIADIFKP